MRKNGILESCLLWVNGSKPIGLWVICNLALAVIGNELLLTLSVDEERIPLG
jgi:hypothetical protein